MTVIVTIAEEDVAIVMIAIVIVAIVICTIVTAVADAVALEEEEVTVDV